MRKGSDGLLRALQAEWRVGGHGVSRNPRSRPRSMCALAGLMIRSYGMAKTEAAADVSRTAGRANGAGEDQVVLLPSRPGAQPFGGLLGPVLAERIGDELGHGQRALASLRFRIAVGSDRAPYGHVRGHRRVGG